MGVTAQILEIVQGTIAPSDETLAAARQRRDEVLAVASRYPGALRTYAAGSIGHGTANDDTDADCGVVLDRRSYPELGPDGNGVGPPSAVEEMRTFIRTSLTGMHANVAFRLTKRAIKVSFHEPLSDGTNPNVDLIVALTRAARGLWIPNLERDRWDASNPEYHTVLLTAEPANLRRTRAKVIRLAKAWNKQYSKPGLSSFNIEALALEAVTEGAGVPDGLAAFFAYAASDLTKRLTPDPAGVSDPIKVLVDRDIIVSRLRHAADLIRVALEHDDDELKAGEALAELYWIHVKPPPGSTSKAAFAAALRQGNAEVSVASGLILGAGKGAPIKTTRSYGGHQR